MRKKPISTFIVTILLLAMLLGAVQFGSGWNSIALDGSGYSHIRYREEDHIECLPGAILCEIFDYGAEGA